MGRLNTYLPDDLEKRLREEAETKDMPLARVLRRILETHYGLRPRSTEPPKPTGVSEPIPAEIPQKPKRKRNRDLSREIMEEEQVERHGGKADRCPHGVPNSAALDLEACVKCAFDGTYGPEKQEEMKTRYAQACEEYQEKSDA